jgi:hypothetical protein
MAAVESTNLISLKVSELVNCLCLASSEATMWDEFGFDPDLSSVQTWRRISCMEITKVAVER